MAVIRKSKSAGQIGKPITTGVRGNSATGIAVARKPVIKKGVATTPGFKGNSSTKTKNIKLY